MSFLKRGHAAQAAIEQEDARAEAFDKGFVRRFWMPKDSERRITFLDGDLTEDGLLNIPMFYEHQMFMNGHWKNWFVCIGEEEPCPICQGGDRPSLVGAMTVIDHNPYTDKSGKEHRNELRLYIAKRDTVKLLTKIAQKRGGLAGASFDVSRIGEDAPNVGSMFDFIEKNEVGVLLQGYGLEGPYNYEEVLTYLSAEELRRLGFGGGSAPVGHGHAPPSAAQGLANGTGGGKVHDFADKL